MLRLTLFSLLLSLFFAFPARAETTNHQNEIMCLADNIYHEAGNQSLTGKIAVTNVVMNRMKQPERFASTACGVIYQRHQFSWVPHRRKSRNSELFRECVEIATRVYYGTYRDVTNGALFYHANYVNPRWRYRPVARIGAHIFYRG